MTPRLKILESLAERMKGISNKCSGGLYGIMYDHALLVVGMSITNPKSEKSNMEQVYDVQLKFPTGVDFCGLVNFSDKLPPHPPDSTVKSLKDVLITDNPIYLQKQLDSDEVKAFIVRNERLISTEFEVYPTEVFQNTFTTLRLRASLSLSSQLDEIKIARKFESLLKKVSSGGTVFHFHNVNFYVYGGDYDEDDDNTSNIGQLYDSSKLIHDKRLKKGALEVSMLLQASYNLFEDPTFAPFISANMQNSRELTVKLPIDALCLVPRTRRAKEIYGLLVDAVCRSINLFQGPFFKILESPERIAELRHYHFLPSVLGHYITLVYPQDMSDEELWQVREVVHNELALPTGFPLFRKGNGLCFTPVEENGNLPLLNVHEGLRPSGVKDGIVSLVKGFYSYHHYMQDGFNDVGWGCAYRSFQTIFSWFRWQGYTEKPVPSHEAIQRSLVEMKDKPPNFVRSRHWIGSTEVSYVLEFFLNIQSRILSVSSGAELVTMGNELAFHFEHNGTPVMIGGGVLAHTILGVDYNQNTGDIKFLVLDPHYTGSENLYTIQHKGWVSWKGKDFWDKNSFYNMCLPQRPSVI